MASYLRSLFGGGQSTKKSRSPSSSSSTPDPKPGRRSHSSTNAPYIYASSGASPVRPSPKRNESYTPARSVPPSPLRYTYDSTTQPAHRATKSPHQKLPIPTRVPLYKSSSYKHEYSTSTRSLISHLTDPLVDLPYPIYSSSSLSHCGSDSRTDSTSSIYPSSVGSSHGHCVIAPPRTSSSASVSHASSRPSRRPVLKQTHTWHADSGPGAAQREYHASCAMVLLITP